MYLDNGKYSGSSYGGSSHFWTGTNKLTSLIWFCVFKSVFSGSWSRLWWAEALLQREMEQYRDWDGLVPGAADDVPGVLRAARHVGVPRPALLHHPRLHQDGSQALVVHHPRPRRPVQGWQDSQKQEEGKRRSFWCLTKQGLRYKTYFYKCFFYV